jgi:hypothetical protein
VLLVIQVTLEMLGTLVMLEMVVVEVLVVELINRRIAAVQVQQLGSAEV